MGHLLRRGRRWKNPRRLQGCCAVVMPISDIHSSTIYKSARYGFVEVDDEKKRTRWVFVWWKLDSKGDHDVGVKVRSTLTIPTFWTRLSSSNTVSVLGACTNGLTHSMIDPAPSMTRVRGIKEGFHHLSSSMSSMAIRTGHEKRWTCDD